MTAGSLRCIAKTSGNLCRSKIEGKHALSIVTDDPIEPFSQIVGAAGRTHAAQLGDPSFDFGGGDR